MMWNPALFAGRDLCRSNVEMPVDLRGIADENFAAKFLSQRNAERRFPRCSRTKHHDERRQRGHRRKIQWRTNKMISTTAASSRIPATWVRLKFTACSRLRGEYCREK